MTTTSVNKLVYTRNQLLSLRNNDKCKELPKGLAALPFSLTRDFVLPTAKPDNSKVNPMVNLRNTCNSDTWLRGSKLVKHVRQNNSYVPPQLRKVEQRKVCDKAELLAFEKTVRGVLNRLTPENFENCMSELNKVQMKSKEHAKCFAEQVFTKAVQQESYSEMYARLVAKFCPLIPEFKSLLLAQCQELFLTGLEKRTASVKACWEEKLKAESNERMKLVLKDSMEEQMCKEKDKYFGNMKFICDLHLQAILPMKLVTTVMRHLLTADLKDCNSLEGGCKMLTLLGKSLESRNKQVLNDLFAKVNELSMSKDLQTKTRFKFKDLVDLRKRNWQLRGIELMKAVVPKAFKELKA